MAKLLHQELTGKIIGIYYDVYNGTARIYPEFIYEQAMIGDLRQEGIACQRQEEYEIFYKDKKVGAQRLDLFVTGEIVVEIKVAPQLTKLHKAQTFSYLKVVGKEVGLLCNFGRVEPEFERLYFRPRLAQDIAEAKQLAQFDQLTEFISPELTGVVINSLYEVHTILGPGFIHRIYANATYYELIQRGLAVQAHREYQVIYRGRMLGEIKFNYLQIENKLLLFPVAIQDINNLSINNFKAWMKIQQIPIAILANFCPEKLEFMVLRV
jgi:GxxExxY protein